MAADSPYDLLPPGARAMARKVALEQRSLENHPFFSAPRRGRCHLPNFPTRRPCPLPQRCVAYTQAQHRRTARRVGRTSTPGPCTAQRGNLKKASWASLYIHHHLSSHRERHRGRSSSSGPVLVRPRRPAGCCCQDQRGHVLASVMEERRLLHLTRVYLRCDTIIKFIACWRHLPLDPTRRWRHWQRPEVARSSLQCTD